MERGQGKPPAGLERLVAEIRACRICRESPRGAPLPHEPRPVLVVSPSARLCVAGQAPGTRVHVSGRPFTDPSGVRLRAWMGIDEETFYDPQRLAILPMGFCFPGQDARGADLPPRAECAPAWRARLFAAMPRLRLVLAIGAHAQAWHLGPLNRPRLGDTVRAWREILDATSRGPGPAVLPLPHPSWRNNRWIADNPWFEDEVLPVLRSLVKDHTS